MSFQITVLLMIVLASCSQGFPIEHDCDHIVVNGRGRGSIVNGYRDHIILGLGRECLESVSDLQVEDNSVKCFKWRLRASGDIQLKDREQDVPTENLTASTSDSVTFRSPGFYNSDKKHYKSSMFCVYKISMVGCNRVTVTSTSGNHHLFDDGRDYLYFDFGDVTTTVKGDSIGSFSESVTASSFYAILWSDAEKSTSAGIFEFETTCYVDIVNNEEKSALVLESDGSGSNLIFS